MFFPKKMLKANIIAHTSILEDLVDAISSSEIMQVDGVEDNLAEEIRCHLNRLQTPGRHSTLLDIEIRMERLFDIFSSHFPSETSMIGDLFSAGPKKRKMAKMGVEELVEKSENILKGVEGTVLKKNQRMADIHDELVRLEEKQAQISLISPLNIPLEFLGKGPYTFTRVGTTDDVGEVERSLEDIAEVATIHASTGIPEAPYVMVIIGLNEVKEGIIKALRGKIFNEVPLPEMKGLPSEKLAEIEGSIKRSHREKEKILSALEGLKEKWGNEIEVHQELLRIKREKYEIYARFGGTEETVVISGWLEAEKRSEFERVLGTLKYLKINFEEPDIENDKVPSSLSHSKFIKPFESLVNTFSPPKYNDLDPTPFVAVLFVLFFGMMLGDAGYGLMILIVCLWIGRKVKEGFLASTAYIGKCVAIVTIITGVATGSFFGDLVQRLIYRDVTRSLYPEFFIGPMKLPYDPLRDPLPLFLIGLGLGLVTIYLSVILSTITHTRQKDRKILILSDIPLMIMIPSFILLILDMLGMMSVPSLLLAIGLGGVAIALILLIIGNISMPLLAVFEVTGFIGDLLSFARILALGLATVGLAMTWNIVGEMFYPGGSSPIVWIVKLLIMLVILVFFHLFNFAFQTLGAGIHSLRLQYIELFNRCYVGGGVLFNPFRSHRVHTEELRLKITKE